MKRRIILSISMAIAAFVTLSAQRLQVRDEVLSDYNKACGLDGLPAFDTYEGGIAPKGYTPFYISHYGRHGSRYAYTSKAYTTWLDMLEEGAAKSNLTQDGELMFNDMRQLWAAVQYKVGDLSPLGWQQQQSLAFLMAQTYPSVFKGNAIVDACASSSIRAIMSMSAFLSAISSNCRPFFVTAHQGLSDIQATAPNMGKNPFRYVGPALELPFKETPDEFFLRRFPDYKAVLGRFFKDADAVILPKTPHYTFIDIYMLVCGMQSIPLAEQLCLKDRIFTADELATMWEIDNYERFCEYYAYKTSCCSIVDDIIAKADARIDASSNGADLRFGHDHVLMTLLMIMDIDGFGTIPAKSDDLAYWFQTFRSPMAANLQFVFYRGRQPSDVLVKVLLNGEEARLGDLGMESAPYYRWADVRSYLNSRTALFVTR